MIQQTLDVAISPSELLWNTLELKLTRFCSRRIKSAAFVGPISFLIKRLCIHLMIMASGNCVE